MTDKLREAIAKIKTEYAEFKDSSVSEYNDGAMYGLDFSIRSLEQALSKYDEWRVPDETTPEDALVWIRWMENGDWMANDFWYSKESQHTPVLVVLAKENQGPPPDDWSVK
jgi:hypothetical protein